MQCAQGRRNPAIRVSQAIGQLARASMQHFSEGEGPTFRRRHMQRKHRKTDDAVSADDISSQASVSSMTAPRHLKVGRFFCGWHKSMRGMLPVNILSPHGKAKNASCPCAVDSKAGAAYTFPCRPPYATTPENVTAVLWREAACFLPMAMKA